MSHLSFMFPFSWKVALLWKRSLNKQSTSLSCWTDPRTIPAGPATLISANSSRWTLLLTLGSMIRPYIVISPLMMRLARSSILSSINRRRSRTIIMLLFRSLPLMVSLPGSLPINVLHSNAKEKTYPVMKKIRSFSFSYI